MERIEVAVTRDALVVTRRLCHVFILFFRAFVALSLLVPVGIFPPGAYDTLAPSSVPPLAWSSVDVFVVVLPSNLALWINLDEIVEPLLCCEKDDLLFL